MESSLPRDSVEWLLEQGFVFRDPARPERLAIPDAFRLQLPASPSDGPRSARIMLQSVPEEARRELCHHHLKRLPPLVPLIVSAKLVPLAFSNDLRMSLWFFPTALPVAIEISVA